MHVRGLAALLCLAALASLGCETEKAKSRSEATQAQNTAKAEQQPNQPNQPNQPVPERRVTDDAAKVVEACGRPLSDTVVAIYDKLYNGPVRRMVYQSRQVVTVEFIPANPQAQPTDVPAPFPPGMRASATPPPDTIWRFQTARMENREFLTSKHLDIYLPCAAHALADEL